MTSLTGTVWKLIETRAFDDKGQELPPPFGPQPMGIAFFGTDRLMVMGCDGRSSLPDDAATRVYVSYTGLYSFDGTTLTTRPDSASSPELLTDQVRTLRFEGASRMIAVPVSRLLGKDSGLELVWERVG